jgi:hypothetical protein
MVQGIGQGLLGDTREHSWLELPDGRTWDPVTCEFGKVRVVSVAVCYGRIEAARKILADRV